MCLPHGRRRRCGEGDGGVHPTPPPPGEVIFVSPIVGGVKEKEKKEKKKKNKNKKKKKKCPYEDPWFHLWGP